MRKTFGAAIVVGLLSTLTLEHASASVFSVAASVDFPLGSQIIETLDGPLLPLSNPVTLDGSFVVSSGDISAPLLSVNPYPGQIFTIINSVDLVGPSLWEITAAGAQDQDLVLQVLFTTPLGNTLANFAGGDVRGFAVLDSSCPNCGFADGGIFPIGKISAVPEPLTWAMLLLGFAGIGFTAYRRRNTLRAA